MKKFNRILLLSILMFSISFESSAQFSLGDIAFSTYHSDATSPDDQFTFVLLKDVTVGEQISFTENGWLASGGFRTGESTCTLTFTSNFSAGTQVSISKTPFQAVNNDNISVGTLDGIGLNLATGGDQIFAYDPANMPSAGDESGFVAAIHMNGTWNPDATSSTTSSKPSIFTDGVNSISINPEVDNAKFKSNHCNDANDINTLRASLNDATKWEVSNIPFSQAPTLCDFTSVLSSSCSAPTAQATSVVFGSDTSSTLNLSSFTAPAGGADGYAIYINDTNSFAAASDGDEPVADLTWNGSGQQTVYFGTSTSPNITVSDLDPGKTYYFQIYAYNDCSGSETYEITGLNANDTTALGVLTITGITGSDKVYDDTTMATASGTAILTGVEPGDDVSLGGSPVFTFASSNVGTGITIITTGYTINGTDAGNYTLTQPTLSGDITTKELTITGITGSDKVYDGTTAATATGTATLSGIIGADDVILGGSPVFTFATSNVGTGITMFTSGYAISGTDSGNYTLTQPTLSGDITAAELTIVGLTGDNKVYDGTTMASASGTAILSGIIGADDLILGGSPVFTLASANVGTGITMFTTGYAISGTDSGNYILTQPTLSGDITGKEITITGITGSDKVYDGTTAATATGTATLSGVIGADDVILGGSPVFTFASSNVGTGITMFTTGYAISGTDSGNYTLTQPTLSGDISAAELTIVGLTGDNKVYDKTTAATANGTATLSGIIGADDVILGGSPVFTFASPEVGTGITMFTTGYAISGTDSGNYTLTQPTLSGDITAAELTIVGLTGDNKVYDGTTAATANGTATLSGIIGADDVILGGSPVFTFASPEVGTGVTITTSGYTISGNDAGNYMLTQPILSGDITSSLNNSDLTLKNQIKLYPNPTKGEVILNTGSISNASIKVFNLSGQVILDEKNINSIFKFNIDESAGLYLVQITSPKGQTAYFKIMKN